MKAAVFTGPYEFKICDREKPKPGPKEVLIRIRAVGICGSDIHPYMGDGIDRREPGIIMGHEASGDVEEVGSEVTKWKPGDRFSINNLLSHNVPQKYSSSVYCHFLIIS